MTEKEKQPGTLVASARPSLLAHIEAKRAKEAERARLRYERGVLRCQVSGVYKNSGV